MKTKIELIFDEQAINYKAIAKVDAKSENEATSKLDSYLEKKYPSFGREECHFKENGIYYFKIVE